MNKNLSTKRSYGNEISKYKTFFYLSNVPDGTSITSRLNEKIS